MGLDSLANTVLTRYKADTADHKAAIRSLRGEEKARHQALLAEVEAQNSKIDSQIAFWGKMAVGIGAAVGAFKLAQASARAYLEDVRLESAAAGASLEGLQSATNGLIEADTLLAFAGKTMHGVWRLNQSEMETVLHGAMALRKTMGVELKPTIESLTEAITKGSTRALKEFGIEAKDKQGVLTQLGAAWQSVGGDASMAGDGMQRAGVSMADTLDDLQGKFGELVLAVEPAIELLAKSIGMIPELISDLQRLVGGSSDLFDTSGNKWIAAQSEIARLKRERGQVVAEMERSLASDAASRKQGQYTGAGASEDSLLFGGDVYAKSMRARLATYDAAIANLESKLPKTVEAFKSAIAAKTAQAAGLKPTRSGGGRKEDPLSISGGDGIVYMLPEVRGGIESLNAGLGDSGVGMSKLGRANSADMDYQAAVASLKDVQAKFAADFEALQADEYSSVLSKIFGTPEEIDQTVIGIQMASDAFNILAQSAGAAFDAWITGQKSIGRAFAEAVAEGLRSTATQMFVESIKHTAFGFGALAFGPIMGVTAAEHFHAAAVFASGAAVAGTMAKGLGGATGQWSAPSGGGGSNGARAPSVVGNGGGRGGDVTRNVTILLGGGFDDLSERERNARLARAVKRGMAAGGSTTMRDE